MEQSSDVFRIGLIPIWLLIIACDRTSDDGSAVEAEVRALLASLDSVQNVGDLNGFADLMSEDIVFMPPDSPPLVGKAAVLEFYGGLFGQATLAIQHDPEESIVEGQLIVHRGRAAGSINPKAEGAAPLDFDSKYLYVLRRADDGRLLFGRVIFNSASVAPAH
jgi:ketosteroid isomerase-like protein